MKTEYQYARARIRDGEKECEFEGPIDFVKESLKSYIGNNTIKEYPEIFVTESHVVSHNNHEEDTSIQTLDAEDLIDFVLAKSFQNQPELIILITYYQTIILKHQCINYDMFNESFNILKRVGIEVPKNLSARLNYLLKDKKEKLLIPIGHGCFKLTSQGKTFVEKMNSSGEYHDK